MFAMISVFSWQNSVSLCPASFVLQGQICQSLQVSLDLLELTPAKDVLFIIGDWNAKVGSQEIPGVTGKFGLGVQMKQGKG